MRSNRAQKIDDRSACSGAPFEVREARELKELQTKDRSAQIVDVRVPAEFEAARIPGSRNIPFDILDPSEIWTELVGLKTPITLVCGSGELAQEAAHIMAAAGFERVGVLDGGLQSWRAENLPMLTTPSRADEVERIIGVFGRGIEAAKTMLARIY